ncbi:ATP-binding protein [Calidifontibacillus oryziterrae]|uniref:ATP-binding protein n=1 Tax=Calidifontibacillus oryziterrae TaxID=1191699 RepID=UPI0002D8BBDB|nr:ATP-binding protein [Calidifontibacillus oryziterrae]
MTKRMFIFLNSIVFLLCSLFLVTILKYPFIGIDVKQNDNKQYEIIKVSSTGLAKDYGLENGDIITSINGTNPDDHFSVKKYNLIEKAQHLAIERDGVIHAFSFITIHQRGQLLLHLVFPLLYLVLATLFSLFLYIKSGNEKVSYVLIILFQLYGISMFAGAASARTEPLAQFFSTAILLFIPLLLLQFFYTYFQKYNIQFVNRKLLKILYGASFSLMFLMLIYLLLPLGNHFYQLTKLLVLLLFVSNVISCLFFFGRGFLKYRKSIYSSFFKIINVAILISFTPYVFLYALPTIGLNWVIMTGEIAFLFTYFLPLSFVYLVTANRLLDIDFYIKRIYYYALFSLIPALLLTTFCLYLINDFSLYLWFQVFTIIYFLFILVFYIKEQLDYRFRNKLFSEKYNLQSSTYQFVQFLAGAKSSDEIEQQFLKEIKSVLGLKNATILEYEKKQAKFQLKNGDDWQYEQTELKSQLKEYIGKNFLGELLSAGSIFYIIIAEQSEKALVLVLGTKRNFTALNLEEKEWLKTISYFVNISYQNMEQIEDLINEIGNIRQNEAAPSWLLRMLFALEEKERKRLSVDLHDSALQQQLLLYRKLTHVLEYYDFDKNIKNELEIINEGLLDVVHDIRETCNELMPPFLKETGIIGSLENLFKKAQLRTNLVIDFKYDKDITITLTDEVTLTIYRIVQELLNNAEKHANASRVHINLKNQFDKLVLQYKDDGKGCDTEKLSTNNVSIGLYGIKERVKSVEGEMDFDSSVEKGLQMMIVIPTQMKDYSLINQ